MSNLVMGVATRYTANDLEPLVKSLRKHYSEDFVLFMYDPDYNMIDMLDYYNVKWETLSSDISNGVEICNVRHLIYKQFLEENPQYDKKVFIIDTRDVIFQDNPFKHETTTSLEFFLENVTYINSECNGNWWIRGIYGEEVYQRMQHKCVVCAGTTLGTREGMMFYLNSIINEIDRMIILRGGNNMSHHNPVVDQPCHGYLIYNNHFPDCKLYLSGHGPVATMNDHNKMIFDKDGNLLNMDGSVVAVVHQWDRTGYFKDHFYKRAIA